MLSSCSRLHPVWRNPLISSHTKLRLAKALVLPIALYGMESLALDVGCCEKLDVAGRKVLRMCMGFHWSDRVSNEELYVLTSTAPLSQLVGARQLSFFGHSARSSSVAAETVTAVCNNLRPPGGHRPGGRRD